MQRTLLALAILSTVSCASFHDTVGTIQEAAITSRATFQPVIDDICSTFAQSCKNEKLTDIGRTVSCDRYEACHQIRDGIISAFQHLQMLLADANMSYAVGDSESASEAVAKATALLQTIRDQLRHLGYLGESK